jgi:uncharacterized membrane protein SirB2
MATWRAPGSGVERAKALKVHLGSGRPFLSAAAFAADNPAMSWDVASSYSVLRAAHIALVIASVSLFTARGLGALAGGQWPLRAPWRRLSMGIDTLLLVAGVALWVLMHHSPLREPWLLVKLLLLPAYVVLGALALRRAPTRGLRAACLFAALAVVALMAVSARTRLPLGLPIA